MTTAERNILFKVKIMTKTSGHTGFVNMRFLLLVIMLLVIAVGQTAGQDSKTKKKKKYFNGTFSFETAYDDNILKYSQKYLDRFMNNEDEGRFNIETYDDLVINPALELGSYVNIFKKQKTEFTLKYSYNAFVVNNIKSWSMFYLGVEQNLSKRASFKFFYSYIPEFYVRHFRDKDWVPIYGYTPQTFVPFSFSKDNYGFWIQNTFFKSTRIRLYLYYAEYFHNSHFTEYDCKNYSYRLQLNQKVTKNFRFDFSYEFLISDAKGYDQPGETKETSDDADASHEGDEFGLGLSYKFPDIKKHDNDLSIDVDYAVRYYTTDNYVELDPEHAGRVDNMLSYAIKYRYRVKKNMYLTAFYRWNGRDSNTESPINSEYVSEEKDYRQGIVGLEYSWRFKF